MGQQTGVFMNILGAHGVRWIVGSSMGVCLLCMGALATGQVPPVAFTQSVAVDQSLRALEPEEPTNDALQNVTLVSPFVKNIGQYPDDILFTADVTGGRMVI